MGAYGDQCAPANPRMPMLEDMKTLMEAAYYGTSFAEVRAGRAAVVDAALETGAEVTPADAKKPARKAGK
jgi:acetaldehyde dehydrogenase/alcohol dehydrogenase